MIYLIWSIINVLILIYFLYLITGFIVKGKRIFKTKFKAISILIMIIGIVQIISASESDKNTNQIKISDDYDKKNNSVIKEIVLEDNLTFDINMLIKYSIEQNEYIPIESNSYLTGIVSGYVWEFDSFDTEISELNNKSEFISKGTLKWNLFGVTVYRESKTFKGKID